MDELEIIVFFLGIIFSVILSGSALYVGVKKLILDFADALKDDVIDKEELIKLLHDLLNIGNIFRIIIKR